MTLRTGNLRIYYSSLKLTGASGEENNKSEEIYKEHREKTKVVKKLIDD